MRADKLRDELMNGDLKTVAAASMSVVDGLQCYPPYARLAALAYVFLSYTRLTGQNPGEVFTAVNNAATEGVVKRPEFRAVDEYLEKETINR